MRKKFQASIFLAVILLAGQASAETYWAATTGSDANSCAAVSGASDPAVYRTAQGVLSCLSAGDTAMYKDGTYDERFTNPLPSGISASQKTIFKGETLAGVIFRPTTNGNVFSLNSARTNIRFTNFTIDGALQGNASTTGFRQSVNAGFDGVEFTFLEIKNIGAGITGGTCSNSITGNAIVLDDDTTNNYIAHVYVHDIGCLNTAGDESGHGVYFRGDNSIVEYSTFQAKDIGIQFWASAGGVNNNIARYNVFRNSKHGLYFANGSGNLAHNNLLINNSSDGAQIHGSTNKFYHNTVYGNGRHGINIFVSNCEVRNNISVGNTTSQKNGSCTTESDNLLTGTPADIFIDPATSVFSLKEGSVAIDNAAAISGFTAHQGIDDPDEADGAGIFDQGCCEAPVRSFASVESGDASNYRITFTVASQGIRDGTGLQGCTTANWALRENAAGKTENSCTIVGQSRVDVGVSAAFTGGTTIDDAYTRGSLTDNICVGGSTAGCKNASVRTYSAKTGTNNVSGGPAATWRVAHFRQFNCTDGTLATPLWVRKEDAAGGTRAPGRLCMDIVLEVSNANPDPTAFEWQFNTGGADALITDVVTTNNIAFINPAPNLSDQDTIVGLPSELTCPHATTVNGKVIGKQTTQPTSDLGQDNCIVFRLLLQVDSDASGTFNLQVYIAGGAEVSYNAPEVGGSNCQTNAPCFVIKQAESRL